MPAQARVSYPNGKVMATTGNIRVPTLPVNTNTTAGWSEFAPDGWEVEMIPDPEPKWTPGDIAQDSGGQVFVRTEAGRWQHVLGVDVEPDRPLTRMVPAT